MRRTSKLVSIALCAFKFAPVAAQDSQSLTPPDVSLPLQIHEGLAYELSETDVVQIWQLNNMDILQMERDRLAQKVLVAERIIEYITNTGDMEGARQAELVAESQDRLLLRQIEQRYLDGIFAIRSIEGGNFGPLQVLLQQRPEFQGQQVEVRPYTDGTIEIYANGQEVSDIPISRLLEDLRAVYETGHREFLARGCPANC